MNNLQLENKKILILGGSGFIGRSLITELMQLESQGSFKNQYDLLIHKTEMRMSKPQFAVKKIKQLTAETQHYDFLIDLVSDVQGYRNDPEKTFEEENRFRNILDQKVLPRCSKKIIISSGVVYGDEITFPTEESPTIAISPHLYTQSKIDLEKRYLQNTKNLNELTLLRFFSVYGPGMNSQMLISKLIEAEKSNLPFVLKSPQQKRSFLFVTDAVKVILQMLCRSDLSGIYNVSSKNVIELNQLKKYFKCIVKDYSINPQPENSLTTSDFHGNSQKLIQELGEFENVGLEEGLGKCLKVKN